jgi:hypothetical protein
MTETKGNITGFRKCRKILLKDLIRISSMVLGGIAILSIALWWSVDFEYFIYTWFYGSIILGLIDLVWYLIILFDCNSMVSGTLPDCISGCRNKYCGSECPTVAYSWCVDMCREIFGNES